MRSLLWPASAVLLFVILILYNVGLLNPYQMQPIAHYSFDQHREELSVCVEPIKDTRFICIDSPHTDPDAVAWCFVSLMEHSCDVARPEDFQRIFEQLR